MGPPVAGAVIRADPRLLHDAGPVPPGDGPEGRDPAMVEFCRVSKRYPTGVTVLSDVTLRIDPEEFVFIVGPTGAGKSTLMKMIYREERPSSGTVLVAGRDVTRLPARDVPFLRRTVGIGRGSGKRQRRFFIH